MKTRIRIQIIPTRLGCWSVWIDSWRIIQSTRDPLVEVAGILIAGGHKPAAALVMTKTPDGPCRLVSTIGNAVVASTQRQPFRAPDWVALHSNGGST
jgi:hypothetical protein